MKRQQKARKKKPAFIARRDNLLGKICSYTQTIGPNVLLEVVELAIEIAREGREGRKVGTIFIVGDADNVKKHSRPLILDPLSRHPTKLKHLTDANLRETVKELSQLDGGFIVDNKGRVLSAARYFDASSAGIEIHLGLGARHMAAASITKRTNAIAVVVSENSIVRIFCNGDLVAEMLPELWLLSRFSSHIKSPEMIKHIDENIAIISQKQ